MKKLILSLIILSGVCYGQDGDLNLLNEYKIGKDKITLDKSGLILGLRRGNIASQFIIMIRTEKNPIASIVVDENTLSYNLLTAIDNGIQLEVNSENKKVTVIRGGNYCNLILNFSNHENGLIASEEIDKTPIFIPSK